MSLYIEDGKVRTDAAAATTLTTKTKTSRNQISVWKRHNRSNAEYTNATRETR